MVWPTLHFPIFLADFDQEQYNLMQFLSIKEIYQVFIQVCNLLLLERLLKNILQSWTIWFDPYCSFKTKKDQTAFELHYTSQNFYQRLYVSSHIVVSSILYKFPQKALFFFLFLSKAVFFLYLHHFK